MKKCDNCGKNFPRLKVIDGRMHSLNNRRYCLECSPFKMHNTRPISELSMHDKQTRKCTACHQEKSINEFYKKGKQPHSECRDCFNERCKARYRANKLRAVEYKGGRCHRCGYAGSVAALDFHHLDRKTKNFAISQIKKWAFARIRIELDKCVLLCANCHRELEALGDKADWSFMTKP